MLPLNRTEERNDHKSISLATNSSKNHSTIQNLRTLLGFDEPWIVGVLNITPDSFSDGGEFYNVERAVSQGIRLRANGAHVVDIGAESTGPGNSAVSAEEEQSRLLEVVTTLAPIVPLSIDTYKASTARFCLEKGACIINDVSALRADKGMVSVISEFDAFVVLMYSKENGASPHVSKSPKVYKDIIAEISKFLSERIEFALKNGISEDKIILDPGMGGFLSPDPKYSWEVLRRFEELTDKFSDFPFMIATSRKGFLGGEITERDPVSQLTAMDALTKGAKLIRTHNVKMCSDFLQCQAVIQKDDSL